MPNEETLADLCREWINARGQLVKIDKLAAAGLTAPRSDTDKFNEFVKAINNMSQRLIGLIGIHDPDLYDALTELVSNGRALLVQRQVKG